MNSPEATADAEHQAMPDRRRRVLVTGGAGFIGSHLVDRLLVEGSRVTVIDNLSTGRLENLPEGAADGLVDGLEIQIADLRQALPALAEREPFDEIHHLAAAVGVERIIERPIESIETNILDTAALLAFASDYANRGAPAPPTLIASSSEVYGKGVKSPFAEDDDCLYGPTTAPRWNYACSKAIDEQLALAHHARHDLPVVIARFFNTVGPRQLGDYGMVLPRFVGCVLEGQSPRVFGDGSQSRCFCDVRDIAPACIRLVRSAECHGRVFNLGSDRSITILDLAHLVIETLAPGERDRLAPSLTPYDKAYAPGFEDLMRRVPDLTRVRQAIGFEPTIDLATTIRDLAAAMNPARESARTQRVECA